MLCPDRLSRRSGKGLTRRKGESWLSVRGGTGLRGPRGVSCPYSVEAGLPSVACISSLNVGLRRAGCVSSRDRGLVRAECLCSLGAGGRKALGRCSFGAALGGAGAAGNLSRREPELCRLGLLDIGVTWTRVKGLMGLGLGPSSARIWAFWMAMRSQETRPDFDGPGRDF